MIDKNAITKPAKLLPMTSPWATGDDVGALVCMSVVGVPVVGVLVVGVLVVGVPVVGVPVVGVPVVGVPVVGVPVVGVPVVGVPVVGADVGDDVGALVSVFCLLFPSLSNTYQTPPRLSPLVD